MLPVEIRLKELLARRRRTQRWLAHQMGVSDNTVSEISRSAIRELPLDRLAAICRL